MPSEPHTGSLVAGQLQHGHFPEQAASILLDEMKKVTPEKYFSFTTDKTVKCEIFQRNYKTSSPSLVKGQPCSFWMSICSSLVNRKLQSDNDRMNIHHWTPLCKHGESSSTFECVIISGSSSLNEIFCSFLFQILLRHIIDGHVVLYSRISIFCFSCFLYNNNMNFTVSFKTSWKLFPKKSFNLYIKVPFIHYIYFRPTEEKNSFTRKPYFMNSFAENPLLDRVFRENYY